MRGNGTVTSIVEGENRGRGVFDRIRQLLTARLPDYAVAHVTVLERPGDLLGGLMRNLHVPGPCRGRKGESERDQQILKASRHSSTTGRWTALVVIMGKRRGLAGLLVAPRFSPSTIVKGGAS
jgi:hypothetical protein